MTNPNQWWAKRKSPGASLLGLTLDGNRLDAVWLRRANGSVQVRRTASITLALDPLADPPELVGREIRKHLDAAGIRERRCTLCVPPAWAMTLTTPLPADLPEADRDSLLQIEAERSFPHPAESLLIARSICLGADGTAWATLVALPRDRVARLEGVFHTAQLRVLSVSLSVTALQSTAGTTPDGVIALAAGQQGVGLQVCAGGGIAVLRALDTDSEPADTGGPHAADLLLREIRVSLGLLPAALREGIRRARVFGRGEAAERLADQLRARAGGLGVTVEHVEAYQAGELGLQLPADAVVSPALSLSVRHLAGRPAELEFLPPRVSAWQRVTTRYASAPLTWAGAAAGGLALIVALAFLVQQWQLARWRSKWTAIKPQVVRVEAMQQDIRRYRPWFDDSFRSLTVLRRLTEAFPEDGVVAAKRVEIRDPGSAGELPVVTCSGTAGNSTALIQLTDRLSAIPGVENVHRDQTRGASPLQFSLTFRWNEGATP